MARAIIPPRVPRVGPLPFVQLAELRDAAGDVLLDPPGCDAMPLSPVWPASGRVEAVGGAYDHTAEAPLYFADALKAANRRVFVGGKTYTVVQAEEETFMPHVALRLREMRPGG